MKMFLAFAAAGMLLVGCGKNSGTATSQTEQGDVTFGYSVVNPSAARAVRNIGAVSKILLSVKDENDSLHYDNYKVDVVNFNGKLVSKSLALNTGYNYNLTQFILLNDVDSALYATPMAGSKNAPLVNAPLPIAFTVGTSPVSLNPEVLPVVDQNPADFGFFNFNSSVVNVDMFNVAVFGLDGVTGINYLVDAELTISNSSGTLITNSLDAATNVVMYKSDEDAMTLTVKKAGFADYTVAVTKAELAAYQNMPLAITLTPSAAQAEKIIFSSNRDGDYDIYVMNPDGSEVVQLTNTTGDERKPKWSPDGTKVVFQSDRDGDNEIFMINADGSNEVKLTDNSTDDSYASFTPDGSKVLFQANHEGDIYAYTMNFDGSNAQKVITFPVWCVRMSPDGTTFVHNTRGTYTHEINSIKTDGTDIKSLSNDPGRHEKEGSYSPDGTKIAYFTNRPTGAVRYRIAVMDADGSNQKNITGTDTSEKREFFPAWSPDGAKIVYSVSPTKTGTFDIEVINADGTEKATINANSSYNDFEPDWK